MPDDQQSPAGGDQPRRPFTSTCACHPLHHRYNRQQQRLV